jgi:hypothetical protein
MTSCWVHSNSLDLCKPQKRIGGGVARRAEILAVFCVCLMPGAGTMRAQGGMFVPTGSMNTARSYFTATLLRNGMVLIAGGIVDAEFTPPLASAELYDPATGLFTPTGSMNKAHLQHTATLLDNGMVLIAGGQDNTRTQSANAELYNPTTGTFTVTGSMNTAREEHTATLLNNGMVLIAGGMSDGDSPRASAELYNPTTGTFTLTGNMNTGRDLHTATLLNNGMVLVAGGYGSTGFSLASAELYDPATGTFTATGSMSEGHGEHTATLLNSGMVLITGGTTGVNGISITIATAELFDPATRTFAPGGSMTEARVDHTATLLENGQVLIAGGVGNVIGGLLSPAELYTPATGTFTSTGSMNTPRTGQTATLMNNGTVLVAGGNPNGGALASAELYELVVVSPASLSFSNQVVGTTSASQTVTLTNNEATSLSITGVAVSGTNASDFAETDNCVGNVPAGASCSINVTFAPPATGSRTGSVTITNNLSTSPLTVALTGTGIPTAPIVSLSATSVGFANQTLGTASAAQTVTLRNTGNATLSIQAVALAGDNSGDFAIINGSTCRNGTTVPPNSSCVIQLTFTPTALGILGATVGITDNAADSPEMINLTGTGASPPLVSVTPSNLTFPAQFVGTSGLPQSVTLTNNGNSPLSITSITVSPVDFALLNACGNTVAAGASCAVGVFFDPTVGGTRAGTLTINDNASGSPQTFALSGTGQDFTMAPDRLLYLFAELLMLWLLSERLRLRMGRRPRLAYGLALLLVACAGLMSACSSGSGGTVGASGSGANLQTPAGSYTVVVSGTFTSGASRLVHNANLTLVVQ